MPRSDGWDITTYKRCRGNPFAATALSVAGATNAPNLLRLGESTFPTPSYSGERLLPDEWMSSGVLAPLVGTMRREQVPEDPADDPDFVYLPLNDDSGSYVWGKFTSTPGLRAASDAFHSSRNSVEQGRLMESGAAAWPAMGGNFVVDKLFLSDKYRFDVRNGVRDFYGNLAVNKSIGQRLGTTDQSSIALNGWEKVMVPPGSFLLIYQATEISVEGSGRAPSTHYIEGADYVARYEILRWNAYRTSSNELLFQAVLSDYPLPAGTGFNLFGAISRVSETTSAWIRQVSFDVSSDPSPGAAQSQFDDANQLGATETIEAEFQLSLPTRRPPDVYDVFRYAGNWYTIASFVDSGPSHKWAVVAVASRQRRFGPLFE